MARYRNRRTGRRRYGRSTGGGGRRRARAGGRRSFGGSRRSGGRQTVRIVLQHAPAPIGDLSQTMMTPHGAAAPAGQPGKARF